MKTWAILVTAALWLAFLASANESRENEVFRASEVALESTFIDNRPAPLRELFRRTEFVYEPSWIRAESGHRLLLQDAINVQQKVYRYDLENDAVSVSIRQGNGPGELYPQGMKWVSKFNDGSHFLYDAGGFRAYLYDADMKRPISVVLPPTQSTPLAMLLVNDTLVMSIPRSETDFAHFFHLKNRRDLESLPRQRISNDDHVELRGLKNFLLKNGHALNDGGALYQSFLFSSLIMKIEGVSVVWLGGTELSPAFPMEKNEPGRFRMPDASKHAQQTLSLAVGGGRVYALHSGVTPSFWRMLKSTLTGNFSEIDELIHASDRLRVHDQATGRFLEEWKLPVRARLISVYDRYLYVVAQLDGVPTIIAYQIES